MTDTEGVQSRHLVDRVENESVWLGCPDLAHVVVRRKAAEGLEPAREVVGYHEVREVGAKLVMVLVVEAFDRRFLDGTVHSLDLAIGPRVVWLREAVLDTVGLANHVEAHGPGRDGVAVPGLLGELNAVVGENGVDLIGHCFKHVLQELPGRLPVRLIDELGHGKLACAVDADEQK